MEKILIINGPNLNLLGTREQSVYGDTSLEEINGLAHEYGVSIGYVVDAVQTNSEGEMIDIIHSAPETYAAVIINAGAYTHTSYAIRDAIVAVNISFVEVHLSNIYSRDEFRHTSVIAPVCIGQICGFGPESYILGIEALKRLLQKEK